MNNEAGMPIWYLLYQIKAFLLCWFSAYSGLERGKQIFDSAKSNTVSRH